VTAPLGDGVILEGVTRGSVLDLARERLGNLTGNEGAEEEEEEEEEEAVEVLERKFTMAEVVAAADEGRLVEAFACGTAFFIAPVEEIHFRGRDVELPLKKQGSGSGEATSYALRIKAWLREIMFGRVEHAWGVVVQEEKE
jgi:branched-chain amino acid aminotransferase